MEMTTQYKWLPSEPTKNMVLAATGRDRLRYDTVEENLIDAYQAMWQAAPEVEQTPVGIDIPETLNKREMIAAMAMQGMLASGSDSVEGNVARWAVEYADELLAELEKTK